MHQAGETPPHRVKLRKEPFFTFEINLTSPFRSDLYSCVEKQQVKRLQKHLYKENNTPLLTIGPSQLGSCDQFFPGKFFIVGYTCNLKSARHGKSVSKIVIYRFRPA